MLRFKKLAEKGHESQKYGDQEYSVHLYQVFHETFVMLKLNTVFKDIFSEEERQLLYDLSWLHDLKEDQIEYYDQHKHKFSEELQEAIDHISHRKGESREDYLDRVIKNKYAHVVKIADTQANLQQSVWDANSKRVIKYTNQLQFLIMEWRNK